jgi:hypothetical protein
MQLVVLLKQMFSVLSYVTFVHFYVQIVPSMLSRLLLCSIQYQIDQVEGFLGHLRDHDTLLKELEKAEKALLDAVLSRDQQIEKERIEAEKLNGSTQGSTGARKPRKSLSSIFTKSSSEQV